MQRVMLKSKIHRATITEANLDYEGSITIDNELLKAANIVPFEQVKIYNISNGERFDTYVISGKAGGGEICLNGAAARKGSPGDLIIIASYAILDENEVANHSPTIVHVDENNRITR
ncbi:MAG: aspartate 1-decarboxylase [Deltaproteobacteria bacterium]|nr:MAG: aspartate 1-decarboxylase [Deltaproteobacteria bacterium]